MWLWIVLGTVSLVVLAGGIYAIKAFSGDDQAGQSSTDTNGGQIVQPQTSAPPSAQAESAGIGDAVRDGKFEFVVKAFECNLFEIGTEAKTLQPEGHFCLVTISVRNIGNESQSLYETNQIGIGANGAEYHTDANASLVANESNRQVWTTPINPGGQVTGVIVFDIADTTQLAQVELHDAVFSDGARVDLK